MNKSFIHASFPNTNFDIVEMNQVNFLSKSTNSANNFPAHVLMHSTKGAFVWDQSGIRIIGIMQVSVRLAALPIPEYSDFHSSYSAPRSIITGIYSRILFQNIPKRTRPKQH